MPQFKANNTDPHGNFFIKFAPENDKKDFYGELLSEREIFRRRGNLPDNNLLTNKLINSLGRNLLNLEEQKLKRDQKHPRFETPERRANIEFYANMERESNAFTISLLDSLSELEQARFDNDDRYTIGNRGAALEANITELYNARIRRLETERDKLSDTPADKIKRQRYNTLISQVTENWDDIKAQLNNPEKKLQSLYRNIMDDFAHEQRNISVYQHGSDRSLDYANESLTEAYQNASYAMEKHIFSNQKPSDEQLHKFSGDPTKSTVLDSRNNPSMRKEDALLSVAIGQADKDGTVGVLDAKKRHVQAVKDASKEAKKAEIPRSSAVLKERARQKEQTNTEQKDITELLPKPPKVAEGIPEQMAAIFESMEAKKPTTVADGMTEVALQAGDTGGSEEKVEDATLAEEVQPEAPPTPTETQQFLDGCNNMAGEQAVRLYQSSDFWSALGLACSDFGKYFEREMASKHPVVTAGAFTAASALGLSAGFGMAGSHAMQGALHFLTKALTLNGKLGISPDQLATGVKAVVGEWNKLTFTHGFFETMVMDGFGLPKINYMIVDTIFNNSEHKDTLMQLAKKISSQNLEYKTDGEQALETAKNIVSVAVLLSAAVSFGLAVHYGAAISTAHAKGLEGMGLKAIKAASKGTSMIINVPPQALTQVGLSHGALQEFLAVVSATLTVKTAGLFLGKGLLLLSHMKDVTEKQRHDTLTLLQLREEYEKDPSGMAEKLKDPAYAQSLLKHAEQLEALLDKNSELKELFGTDFLNIIGVTRPMTFAEKVADKYDTEGLGAAVGQVFSSAGSSLKEGAQATLGVFSAIGSKFLKPTGLILGTLLTFGFLPTIIRKATGNQHHALAAETETAYFNFTLGLSKIGETIGAGLKTLSISLYGAVQRVTMALSDTLFGIAALANYGYEKGANKGGPVLGFLGALGAVIGGGAAKLGLGVCSLVGKALSFVGKIIKYPLTAVTGILGVIGGALLTPFVAAFGKKGAVAKFWKEDVRSFMKFPLTAADKIYDNVTEPALGGLAAATDLIDAEVYSVKGADSIQGTRDKVTTNIAYGFDRLKQFAGNVLYKARNLFIREQERFLQDVNVPMENNNHAMDRLSSPTEVVERAVDNVEENASPTPTVISPKGETEVVGEAKKEVEALPQQQGAQETAQPNKGILKKGVATKDDQPKKKVHFAAEQNVEDEKGTPQAGVSG